MCDSVVALGDVTADGRVLFAKNSDRVPPDECQPLVHHPRRTHASGATLGCQYLEITQVPETAALIGSRPYWLWGFEHGLNEYGVAIGNHTVFARDPVSDVGLMGMDLVRLGLERGRSAREAVEVITDLIERYGQGGSGFVDKHWPYHNSFLVADRARAYVLETSDRRWAVRRVDETASVSNHLSIGTDWEEISADAIDHARAQGWWRADAGDRLDFAAAFRDLNYPAFISSGRQRRTSELVTAGRGQVTPATMRAVLRDHYGEGVVPRTDHAPEDERSYAVCQHVPGVGSTTASAVVRLGRDDETLVYWGSFGSPCLGVFLPYYVEAALPAALAQGGASATLDSPWWRFYELSRQVAADPGARAPIVRAAWDALEARVESERPGVEARALREGPDVLTAFMQANVDVMTTTLESLIANPLGR